MVRSVILVVCLLAVCMALSALGDDVGAQQAEANSLVQAPEERDPPSKGPTSLATTTTPLASSDRPAPPPANTTSWVTGSFLIAGMSGLICLTILMFYRVASAEKRASLDRELLLKDVRLVVQQEFRDAVALLTGSIQEQNKRTSDLRLSRLQSVFRGVFDEVWPLAHAAISEMVEHGRRPVIQKAEAIEQRLEGLRHVMTTQRAASQPARPTTMPALVRLVQYHIGLGELRQAEDILHDGLSRRPYYLDLYYYLSDVLLRQEHGQQSLDALARGLRRTAGKSPRTVRPYQVTRQLAATLEASGYPRLAEQIYQRAEQRRAFPSTCQWRLEAIDLLRILKDEGVTTESTPEPPRETSHCFDPNAVAPVPGVASDAAARADRKSEFHANAKSIPECPTNPSQTTKTFFSKSLLDTISSEANDPVCPDSEQQTAASASLDAASEIELATQFEEEPDFPSTTPPSQSRQERGEGVCLLTESDLAEVDPDTWIAQSDVEAGPGAERQNSEDDQTTLSQPEDEPPWWTTRHGQ